MRVSILVKIISVLVISVLITGISVFFMAKNFMTAGFEREAQVSLEKMQQVVNLEINNLKDKYLEVSRVLAENPLVIEAISIRDIDTLREIVSHNMRRTQAQAMTIVDHEGNVILRGHSSKAGDNLGLLNVVKTALQGRESVNIESGTTVKFSVRAASPIRIGQKVIGALMLTEALDSHRFVDKMKKYLNVEMTIFQGNMRISTTLLRDGQRAINTRLENPAILKAVMQEGKTYEADSVLFEKHYKTIYWPLRDEAHEIIGMWFLGLDHSSVSHVINKITLSCIWAVAIIAAALGLLGAFFARSLILPLKRVVVYAKAVANGDLSAQLDVHRRDEIGDLSKALHHMVDDLKSEIKEAEAATAMAHEKSSQAEDAKHEAMEAARLAKHAKREGMLAAARELDGMSAAISAAATQLSTQIEQSDKSSVEASERLAEAATSMQQMNAAIQEVAKNASQAAAVSVETHSNAEDGQRILDRALKSINQVQQVSMELKDNMGALHEDAQSISQIMSVIPEVSENGEPFCQKNDT